jgi:hypothetical protein
MLVQFVRFVLFLFFWWDWGLNSGFPAEAGLSHTSSPFCASYFGDGFTQLFALAGLEL